jgi:hypothetical protein
MSIMNLEGESQESYCISSLVDNLKSLLMLSPWLCLLGLEEENGTVSEIEVDEVLRFFSLSAIAQSATGASELTVGDKGTEVAANNAMPGCAFADIELDSCQITFWVSSRR